MLLAPIMWVLIGLIAGWAAGKIMKGSGYGLIIDIILGMVGAVVGGWLMVCSASIREISLAQSLSPLSVPSF